MATSPKELSPVEDISLFIYTLCFLTRGDQVLMLYRNNPPNQGLWNGVGGKIIGGESPEDACLREVREETGYCLSTVHFAGMLTWRGFEISVGGLFIFSSVVPEFEPVANEEGLLGWKPRDWACTSSEVVSNIHYFLPHVLDGTLPQVYHFEYVDGAIAGHRVAPLPGWANNEYVYSASLTKL